MDAGARWLVMAVVVLADLARSWSCGEVLKTFSPMDDVPYANFDRHGISAGTGLVGTLVFLPPILWLAARIVRVAGRTSPADGADPRAAVVAGSGLIALAIGLPSFVQLDYLIALPLALAWPVLASAVTWALLVAALWLAWLHRRPAPAEVAFLRWRAATLAVLVTLPKVMLLTI